jgi:CrcB protein
VAGPPDAGEPHPERPVDPETGPISPALVGLVGVGGVVGTAVRYAVERGLPAGTGFPFGTLLINLAGAMVLGVLLEALARHGPDIGSRQRLRLLVGTGFCGGLTTYSTLAVETDLLLRAHRDALAVGYAVTSVVAGIAAAAVGIAIGIRAHRRLA